MPTSFLTTQRRHATRVTRRRGLLAGLAAAALLLPTNLLAWGDAGHRMIGLAAAERLPSDVPAFFRAAGLQLGYLNPEPDRWKNRDETFLDPALAGGTSPEHYIDMDLVSPAALHSALAAPNRFAFDDTLRGAGSSGSAMGLLPFAMIELTQKLRNDFRLWRIAPDSTVRQWIEARIIDDAGILGHYVADGSNPLHTTKHHNGWVGDNPNGYTIDKTLHSRFESQFVQGQTKLPDVLAAMNGTPRVLPNVRDAVVEYLNTSFAQLDRLYEIEKATPFRAETATSEQKTFAVARLAAGAEMLRDIWYTAWITSGQAVPVPPRRPPAPSSHGMR